MLATEGHKFCLGHLPLNQVDKEYLQQHSSPKVLDWLRLAQDRHVTAPVVPSHNSSGLIFVR
jgi:hypothetical protein